MIDLQVWPDQVADGSLNNNTPGKGGSGRAKVQKINKLAKKYRNGHIPKVDWLDRLAFREIELVNEKEKRNSQFLYLMVEFPKFEQNGVNYAMVYYEKDGDGIYQFRVQADIVTVPDSEILLENLVEVKHHKLARSLRSGMSDKDVKPNAAVRDQLHTIVAYPPTKALTAEEQDLVWKFRFYLSSQEKALTKFLKCVNWNSPPEAKQALDLLPLWAPMDVEDALELLSPNFTHPAVRRYAVSRLSQAPDEDLLLYLLQLVQALKYENYEEIAALSNEIVIETENSGRKFSSADNESIPKQTKELKKSSSSVNSSDSAISAPSTARAASQMDGNTLTEASTEPVKPLELNMDLATFLIHRACLNSTLTNYFFWYLWTECDKDDVTGKPDTKERNMYLAVFSRFLQTLQKGLPEWQSRRAFLRKQQVFMDKLVSLMKSIARESGNRKKKIERLQSMLANPDAFNYNFADFKPFPFPLDPDVVIKGIVPEKTTLFKSALMPSRLTFRSTTGQEYVAIFKHGDDLRQDQLILQIITLMDKLLRRENLDLKLTPYRVLATSSKHGLVQFVESMPVAEVLATEGTIQNFFRKHNPSENGPYGIAAEVMDTYVRSCAGYCVITYILGVGDRHLDNLLLTTSGKLFHIDFGYILGRDPKPLPPPMKLSKEMVEAMGGINAEHYQEFRKQCYTAFLHLRRHANLILNLFSLMVDASVPDIALEPDKAVQKVQDKLRLDLGDEEAVSYVQGQLDLSVTAVMAALVEQLHKFAQYWRK
ncbi:Hypothetical predicted protein [Cloeon dipterum]|uniref:Phosphatidylinositol 3-kinase catalytic subunit type 3 n=1 Tax=Cloeon dipterum TaxID=197152 RepID=A0A8S1E2C1_9INSE|nr:Hypothetical predicted protein [Cloeon dipterum]